jgi:cytochrome c-type biogenesis protein CcmE
VDDRSRQLDDEPSADEVGDDGGRVGLDLSPRPTPDAGRATGSGPRRWPWLLVIVALIGGIGFVISRALTDATQFYLTADEAVARKAEFGDRSFRLEGSVVEGTTAGRPGGATFEVSSNGVRVPVDHSGTLPEIFQSCIPVVVEGRWEGERFASTSIIVAHDEQYEEENSQRMQQARAAGAESNACAQRDLAAAP